MGKVNANSQWAETVFPGLLTNIWPVYKYMKRAEEYR
jgi:hypothetical protein